nr:response regulator [Pseudobutyrivibrio sp.]
MLKVLLVDDEPFILQGLQVLVDWAAEGYEIHTACNGLEALDYINNNLVDLVIADIKMPVMSGLELLRELRETNNSDVYFVILSGFAEFSYAQEALRYNCTEYILKPVEADQLLAILRKVASLNQQKEYQLQDRAKKERAYMDRNLMALLSGKYDGANVDFLSDKMNINDEMCYVEIQLDEATLSEDYSDEDKKEQLRKLYAASEDFLKNDFSMCIMDVSDSEKIFDIGFIYTESMGQRLSLTEKEYLEEFLDYLIANTNLSLTMLVGKRVAGIKNISKSYGTANMLRSLQGFREKKPVYYYEEEYRICECGIIICKKQLDELIEAIERGEHVEIHEKVD